MQWSKKYRISPLNVEMFLGMDREVHVLKYGT